MNRNHTLFIPRNIAKLNSKLQTSKKFQSESARAGDDLKQSGASFLPFSGQHHYRRHDGGSSGEAGGNPERAKENLFVNPGQLDAGGNLQCLAFWNDDGFFPSVECVIDFQLLALAPRRIAQGSIA